MGDESSMFWAPSSPTSTGQVFLFSHPWVSLCNSPGGSVIETKEPPSTWSVVCVEQKVRRSVFSLSSPSQDVARWTRDLFLATPTRDVYPCPFGCVLQCGKSALADSDLTLGSFVPRQVLISTYL